jgi:hypothetical protein
MINWLKYKLRNWILNDEPEVVHSKLSRRNALSVADDHSLDSDKGIRITAYKAQGGMVVETNFYDRIKDRSYRTLHIITDDKDLGKEIGKIITMETLKI